MELIKSCIKAVNSANAKDIKIYETKTINPLFDYAIIATVSTNRQLNAVISHAGFQIRGVEGRGGGCWLLVDLYSCVIHVFTEEERQHYNLDKLWSDLPQLNYKDFE